MAGYTRQSIADIINGADITAPPLNREFNQIAAAFHPVTGHTHDATAGNAPLINLPTATTGALPAARGGTGGVNNLTAVVGPVATNDSVQGYAPGSLWFDINAVRVYICSDASASAAVWTEITTVFAGNLISPDINNTVDLGTDTARFKDLWMAGNASIGGTLSVTGNTTLAGTLSVTGNITGNITGDITSAGTSTFGTVSVGTAITVPTPTVDAHAATKAYVDAVQNSLDPANVQSQLDLKAPLASPALTGAPTAPTPAANNSSTAIATTAYVQTELTDQYTQVTADIAALNTSVQADIDAEASLIRTEFAAGDATVQGNLNTVNNNLNTQRINDLRWVVSSANTSAQEGQKIAADVSSGPWTLTLPAFPATGSAVTVSVIAGNPAVNNLTIVGNTHDIQGNSSLVVDVAMSPIELTLVYNGTEWRIA